VKRVPQPHGGTLAIPEKGDRFNPKGRPPKVFSQLAKEFKERGIEQATPEAVKEIYEYLLALTLDEIRLIAGQVEAPSLEVETEEGEVIEAKKKTGEDKNDFPAIMRIAASELTSKRKREILNDMLDRAHGKAKQVNEVTGKDGEKLFNITPASAEQIDALLTAINGASE
jgi:hypothetical protein